MVCVVETWQELLAIEKTVDIGVFHVLGGAICPVEGVGPENLNIIPLIRGQKPAAQDNMKLFWLLIRRPKEKQRHHILPVN